MSCKLKHYLQDGANYQARAVLMALQGWECHFNWNDQYKCYDDEAEVGRWENCREQGYVVSLNPRSKREQLNIAFFEHRNSDSIHAIKWIQSDLNSITINNMDCPEYLESKYNTTFSVSVGEYEKMAQWIYSQLKEHSGETH